jgi:hypothetical protein
MNIQSPFLLKPKKGEYQMEQNADGNANDLNAGSGQVTGIRAQFSDPLKNHEAFTGFNKADDLANAYLETMGKAKDYEGKLANSIPKLSDNSTKEEREAFFQAIGRPDKPEGYELKVPDGVPVDPKLVDGFQKLAFENGLSKPQVAKLAEWYIQNQVSGTQSFEKAIKERQEKAVNELKDEWGGEYDAKLDKANQAVARIVDDDTYEYMKGYGLTNDSRMVKFFYRLSEVISEDAFIPQKGTPPRQRAKTPGGQPMLEFPSMDK